MQLASYLKSTVSANVAAIATINAIVLMLEVFIFNSVTVEKPKKRLLIGIGIKPQSKINKLILLSLMMVSWQS